MTTVLFDTLALARKLEEAGFPSQQAQATSAAFAEILTGEVATGRNVDQSRIALEHRIDSVHQELDAKIEAVRQELDAKIEAVRQELDAKIEAVRLALDARIEQMEQRLTLRLGGMMAAAIGIVAVLVRLL